MRILGAALARRQCPSPGSFPAAERRALDAFRASTRDRSARSSPIRRQLESADRDCRAHLPGTETGPAARCAQRRRDLGQATLLLDGLDECRERRGVVVDSLTAVTAELPNNAGAANDT
jgi:hypothetical protein